MTKQEVVETTSLSENLPNEEWRETGILEIEVSNYSRLKRNGQIIKKHIIKGRYMAVITHKTKTINLNPARLTALAFIPNPNNLPDVLHKDKNNLNDDIKNLEWGKRERNQNKKTGEKHGMAILKKKEVLEIREKRKQGFSFAELSQDYGVSIGCIQGVLTRNWKSVK